VGARIGGRAVFRPAARPRVSTKKSEIYVEFVAQGKVVKATAIDSATGIEASIMGPASAGRAMLTKAALRKLNFVLKKKR
jgi:hypothetical protein